MADLSKLHPVFRARLERMMAATGTSLRSGWRSSQEQEYLYNCYRTGNCNNGNPANPPGSSNHEAVPWGEPMALAADLMGNLAAAHEVCRNYGIHFPIQSVEEWHCQPVEARYAYWNGMPDFPDEPGEQGPDVSARRRNPDELRVSSQGAALAAEFEGFSATVYRDPVGVETIGYGETRADIIDAYRGREMSQDDAYRLLVERMENDYAPAVRAVGAPLAQSEFDALCSFTYNLGARIFDGNSTIGNALRAADYVGVADAFGLYVNAGGKRLAGLVRRRAREAELFRSEWGQSPEEDDMPAPAFVVGFLDLAEGEEALEIPMPPPQGSGGIDFGSVVVSFSSPVDVRLSVWKHHADGAGVPHPQADANGVVLIKGRAGRHAAVEINPDEQSIQVGLAPGENPRHVQVGYLVEVGPPPR